MINLGTRRHVARKAHRCESCGRRINPGEPYNSTRMVDGGDAWVWKAHTYCDAASQYLHDLGFEGDDGVLLSVSDFGNEDCTIIRGELPEIWQAMTGRCQGIT